MVLLELKINIKAPKEKIWEVLWTDKLYRTWTNVFCEGSYFVTNWQEGSSIQFMAPNGVGMESIISENKENEYMAFTHVSEIKDYKVAAIDEKTKEWSGAMETYRLVQKESSVDLIVKIDVLEKYLDYFQENFPKGLGKVKELSEK